MSAGLKNILFVSPSNAIGGAEISLLEMVRYLHAQGSKVVVALPPAADDRFAAMLRPCVAELIFLPMMPWNCFPKFSPKGWAKRLWVSRGAFFYSLPRLLRVIRKHKIEVVHTNSLLVIDGALAAKWAGVPHVQHLREVTGYRPDALFQMLGQRHPRRFKKMMHWLHSAVIANSKFMAVAAAEYFPEGKTRVMYNIVESAPAASRCFIPRTIGMVANVSSKVKNHALFIQIAAKMAHATPDLHFYIFGKLPAEGDPYRQDLQKMILENDLADRLVFKGSCSDQAAVYSQIGVLLHPFAHESFGRVFIESMAHGVPVVAAQGGAARELIQSGETGFLFEPTDTSAAARLALHILENPLEYARIVANGQAFAQQFRQEHIGPQWLRLYEGLPLKSKS